MLFPYTTLFRSRRGAPVRERRRSWGHLDARVGNRRARLRRRESHRIETRPTRRRIDAAGGMAGRSEERRVGKEGGCGRAHEDETGKGGGLTATAEATRGATTAGRHAGA